jgi:hypothetical protein
MKTDKMTDLFLACSETIVIGIVAVRGGHGRAVDRISPESEE